MSCCSSCQQGFDCAGLAGWPFSAGLAGLGAIPAAQASALDKYVLAGSVIEWGGKILWPDDDSSISWHEDAQKRIKDALWNHGGFSMVDAGNIGGFRVPYISIVVTTRTDFGKLADVLGTIEGAIYQAGYRPSTENFWVKSTPAQAQGRADVAQSNAGAGSPAPNPKPEGKTFCETFPKLCPDSNDDGFLNTLAQWLGVSPTEAAIVGAGAALLTVLIVKKAL